MPAILVDAENGAGIGGQFGERETARRLILRGSVAHDAITSFRTDQHEIGRPGFRTALGATGDMNRPGETKRRQQRRKAASIAAGVESGRLTTWCAWAGFDLQQRVARVGYQALALCGIKNAPVPIGGWAPRHRARATAKA